MLLISRTLTMSRMLEQMTARITGDSTSPVTLIGSSLGAALAILLAKPQSGARRAARAPCTSRHARENLATRCCHPNASLSGSDLAR